MYTGSAGLRGLCGLCRALEALQALWPERPVRPRVFLSRYMISEVLRHRDPDAEKPACSYTLNVHQDFSQMLSSQYFEGVSIRVLPSNRTVSRTGRRRKPSPT